MFNQRRSSKPYGRITRANRQARARASAAAAGLPIRCPRSGCGYMVPPSVVSGTEEYWCHNHNHGRVAMRIDGQLEFLPEADLVPTPDAHRRRRKHVPCASPGCASQRRGTCGRVLCWTHCVQLAEPCGCREHDRERKRRATGRASPPPRHRSHTRRSLTRRSPHRNSKGASSRRRASSSVSPRRASSSVSPRRRRSSSASPRRRRSSSSPPRHRRAPSGRSPLRRSDKSSSRYNSDDDPPRPSRSPPSRRPTSAPPQPQLVPGWLEISMRLMDVGFHANVVVPRVQDKFYLRDLSEDASGRLHLNEAKSGTLIFLQRNGTWRDVTDEPVYFFHDQPDADTGYVYLRAKALDKLRRFPTSYFVDMAERLRAFQSFTGDREHRMTDEEAFFSLFDFEATADDLEQLELCLSVVDASPPQLREKFEHAGRTAKGTWSEFIHECKDHKDTPAATRVLCQSPLLHSRQQDARSPVRRKRALSPDLGASPGRFSPDLGASPRRLSPDLGASSGRSSRSSRSSGSSSPSSRSAPAWRGPPASQASSSGGGHTWDDEDDMYAD
ncbi:hypothetical protein AURDEDRAFT_176723 [Auricularia subglabra TFB-10046 SS5]|uniref:Uncharacterized protein n=1 Tax=Auricularia subglabra (strain TFB-10046 / SS5) TaxID=717982 RepID=J0CV04_AURST|nr:hypothetical protein AURDEDRAFT_176723 [Auricularia subglabra TFB-10046 SS5]